MTVNTYQGTKGNRATKHQQFYGATKIAMAKYLKSSNKPNLKA